MKEYQELMQYEPWVDVDKTHQELNVRKSAHNERYAVGLKYFTFDEFISAIKAGHSIKRVHTYNQKFVPTKFITIDIDDVDAKVTKEEISIFSNKNCVILNSTSRKSF